MELEKASLMDMAKELERRGIKQMPTRRHLLTGKSECPHCGHKGPIERDFGTRVLRGDVVPQSWCRICASGRTR